VGIHGDILLNVNLNINNENQDCTIGTVCAGGRVLVGGERVKEGDSILITDFIHLY
jgi:hypothetical protein